MSDRCGNYIDISWLICPPCDKPKGHQGRHGSAHIADEWDDTTQGRLEALTAAPSATFRSETPKPPPPDEYWLTVEEVRASEGLYRRPWWARITRWWR